MPETSTIRLDTLLENARVADAVSDVNQDLQERMSYQPPICEVFKSEFTSLKADLQYEFEIDKEARKQLTNIIGNTVQRIENGDDANGEMKETYSKVRKIGIVFSGGPSPGGHNVIAGLFDAAKQVNPQTRIFGFLMGPDGIIEGDFVELTRIRLTNFVMWAVSP
jgi:pyrophosphate--fructose-6-phosphate 1-phosphotransferase